MRITAVVALVLALRFAAPAPLPKISPVLRVVQRPEDMIFEESLRAGINPHLPLMIGWRESRYNPSAVSRAHAVGVMQLMPHTVRVLHVARPFDARQNIIAGVWLFAAWKRICASDAAAMYAYAHGRCR